jgi:DNA-binding transcriptional MerR regulator
MVRISELARQAAFSIPTLKYYIREGLLQAGTAVAPNRADYGDDHVNRLRLIRTLREIGGLDIGRIKRIVSAIEDESLSRHELFGVVERARAADVADPASSETAASRAEVDRFIDELGWRVRPDAAGRQELANALVALRGLGRDYDAGVFRPYAEAADRMAAREVRSISTAEPHSVAVERMVVGTVVFGAVFDTLRRLAHEHHSSGSD